MKFLSVPEAAARRGVDRVTVFRWIDSGALRAVKIGNRWAIDERHLAKFRPKPVGNPKWKKRA